MPSRILLIEDEAAQRVALQRFLVKRGYEVDAVATGEDGLDALREQSFAAVITDLRLPGVDGLDVVRGVREIDEDVAVLLMTAYASVDSAVEALRVGAHDYLLKPLILDEVERKIEFLLRNRELAQENLRLRRALHETQRATEMIAESPAMQDVLRWVERAAATPSTVLITGETGTGKEVVARTIHELSPQHDEPFLAVNLASLPDTMAESELFGHEKGAFTGAQTKRDGLLRAAGKGTVLLDEVGELPLPLQAKLLRALEAREVRPVGRDRPVPIEARILAATNRNLEAMVADGAFREDLYYRLNVLIIEVPPLRERQEDIPALARELLRRHTRRSGAPVPMLSPEAVRALCRYRWPGNVRELGNVLERATVLASQGVIDVSDLPSDLGNEEADDLSLATALERHERTHIGLVLRLCDGNRELAAKQLGISPATLYRRLEKHGLKGFEVRRGSHATT